MLPKVVTSRPRNRRTSVARSQDCGALGLPDTKPLLDSVGLFDRFLSDAHGLHQDADMLQVAAKAFGSDGTARLLRSPFAVGHGREL